MNQEEYEGLSKKQQKYVCEEHGVPLLADGFGGFSCPFCEKGEWEENL